MNESRPPEEKQRIASALRHHLATARSRRQEAARDDVSAWGRTRLREWQASRLARTYADLLASPRYGRAAQFFLSDLYSPRDFSGRDEELERIYPLLVSMLPVPALRTMTLAVELDALTEALDSAMVHALDAAGQRANIDENAYSAAYRTVGQRASRWRQITLIRETGEALAMLSAKPMLTSLLKLMRGPAHLAGLGELHEFLENGFAAFRHMGDASDFLDCIEQRESRLLENMFAGRANPFRL